MKKLIVLLIAILSVFSLAACGQSTSQETLRVAVTPTGPPYTFMNPKNSQIEGIMVDIIKELGKRTGIEVQLSPMQFSSLIPSLKERKVDAISAGMLITPERQKEVAFTQPVFGFGEGLVVQASDTKTKTLQDLKGKVIGVQMGTTYKDYVEKSGITDQVKVYKAIGEMLKDLDNKRLDAVVADQPVLVYLKQQNPNFKIRIVEDYKPSVVGDTGIALAKNNKQLLDKLNKEIPKMKQDGSLQKIYQKWGVKWE